MIAERQYIKDNLYDFFAAILADQGIDMPLIYDNGNGTRPLAPFLMIGFRSTVTPGMPNYSGVDTKDGKEIQSITQYVRRNMTMYGFGERAIDALETIKSQLNVGRWVDTLRLKQLVIPQVFETVESPQAFETSRENGASFDFDLTYLRVIGTEPGYITDVNTVIEPDNFR
jgi:hypothetical protein